MAIPRITVNLAGGTRTGKTMFMHGMYNRLAVGLHEYFLYCLDTDDEIDLLETWERLQDDGEMARTNQAPRTYSFRFAKLMTPLLDMTWNDYRGGVNTESGNKPNSPGDIAEWRKERLPESDSVYLVLDGAALGTWVKNGTPQTTSFASGGMKLPRFNYVIRTAMEGREALGNPPPSFVVLVTKMDMLSVKSGMSTNEAFKTAVINLENLLPHLFAEGMTVLCCPVQIGDFKTDMAEDRRVDRALIRPQHLHRPICFSLWYYLTETLTANKQQLAGIERKLTESDGELAELRAKSFLLGKRRKIDAARSAHSSWQMEKAGVEAEMSATTSQAELLMREFHRLPIIKDGQILWPSDGPS